MKQSESRMQGKTYYIGIGIETRSKQRSLIKIWGRTLGISQIVEYELRLGFTRPPSSTVASSVLQIPLEHPLCPLNCEFSNVKDCIWTFPVSSSILDTWNVLNNCLQNEQYSQLSPQVKGNTKEFILSVAILCSGWILFHSPLSCYWTCFSKLCYSKFD